MNLQRWLRSWRNLRQVRAVINKNRAVELQAAIQQRRTLVKVASVGGLAAAIGLQSHPALADQNFTAFGFPATNTSYNRTMPARLADIRNVKDFGALGDGTGALLSTRFGSLGAAQAVYSFVTSLSSTIDWAACQAAHNAAIPMGGIVFFPAGQYNLGADKVGSGNANTSAPRPAIRWLGEGGTDYTLGTYISGTSPSWLFDTTNSLTFTGNITSGSNVISNVVVTGLSPGDFTGIGYTDATYISGFGIGVAGLNEVPRTTAGNPGAQTLTLRRNCTQTATGVTFTCSNSNVTGIVSSIEHITFQNNGARGGGVLISTLLAAEVSHCSFFTASVANVALSFPSIFCATVRNCSFNGPGSVDCVAINWGASVSRTENCRFQSWGTAIYASVYNQGCTIIGAGMETCRLGIEFYCTGMILGCQTESNRISIYHSGSSTLIAGNFISGYQGTSTYTFLDSGIILKGGRDNAVIANSFSIGYLNASVDISDVNGQNLVLIANQATCWETCTLAGASIAGSTLTVPAGGVSGGSGLIFTGQGFDVVGDGMHLKNGATDYGIILRQLTSNESGGALGLGGTYKLSTTPGTVAATTMTGFWPGVNWKMPTSYRNGKSDITFVGNNGPYTGVTFANLPVLDASEDGASKVLKVGDAYECSDCPTTAIGAAVTTGGGTNKYLLGWRGSNWLRII